MKWLRKFGIAQMMKSVRQFFHSPFALQSTVLSILFLFLTGFMPTYGWGEDTGFGIEFGANRALAFPVSEVGFTDIYAGARTSTLEQIVTIDEEGNSQIVRQQKTRKTQTNHSVKSGETIPSIALDYGLKVRSVLWANNLNLTDKIDVGQVLRIPPQDGVYYQVQKGDTLSDIAEAHSVTSEEIVANNNLGSKKVLKIDEEVFIPGAQKVFIAAKPDEPAKAVKVISQNNTKAKTKAATRTAATSNGKTAPNNAPKVGSSISRLGYKILRPTKGSQTQGYHRGHLALDIASSMNTPIYAVAPGRVITSQDGWNGGYGRYIIVDHGGGVHSLYAHNTKSSRGRLGRGRRADSPDGKHWASFWPNGYPPAL